MKSSAFSRGSTSNMYILGFKNLSLIDPGGHNESELGVLAECLKTYAQEGKHLKQIILSHQHRDSVATAEWIREKYKTPILSSQITKDLIAPYFEVDEVFEDGDSISIDAGMNLQCIFCPGHAAGHFAFLESQSKTLISGDMISGFGSVRVTPFNGGHMASYIASLKKLSDNDAYDLALPTHGSPYENPQAAFRKLIEHKNYRQSRVMDLINKGGKLKLEDLARKVYEDRHENMEVEAILSTMAYIQKLKEEKQISENYPLA